MLRTVDGVCVELVTESGGETRLRPIDEENEPAKSSDSGRGPILISKTLDELRALFEGSTLSRARATASLTSVQLTMIFGTWKDRRYPHARALVRIGKTIRDPDVIAVLEHEPLRFLLEAAKQRDPRAQIAAAVKAKVLEGVGKAPGRKRRTKDEET